jgi:2'-5' RNA ligase
VHDDEMASDPSEYWARRRTLSPSPVQQVVADGDRRLSVLADVSKSAVRTQSLTLLERLDKFSCLRVTPPNDLHLTVKLFNAGRSPTGRIDTDHVRQVTSQVAADTTSFDVEFPRLNLFPDTVYAEADGDGALTKLNRLFCQAAETTDTDRDCEGFIPHLTLGYFTDDEDYDELIDYMEANRDPELPTLTVDELALVSFDTTNDRHTVAEKIATYTL